MIALVTGAAGFIGRNLIARLSADSDNTVIGFDIANTKAELAAGLAVADVVFHLAGVNRPEDPADFEKENAGLTHEICTILRQLGGRPRIVMSSSIQASLENPYGISKRHGEEILQCFAAETGAEVRILRLKNVFGKWCRPNYNSVVATFCQNVANDLPLSISDSSRELELVYIDDVVNALVSGTGADIPSHSITLGELAGRIQSFQEMRGSLFTPDFALRFNQNLYATYLSYVPDDARRHQLVIRSDERGSLAEFIKSRHFGQIFISRTRSGVTRGNHYHQTKAEKFFVVQGEGVIRMRQIESAQVVEYPVRGEEYQVIDIPPGYTHSIENTGSGVMVTLFWASEIFDPDRPDTYFLPVQIPTDGRVPTAI